MFEHETYPSVIRSEICTVAAVRRVASMLDLDPELIVPGSLLPKGWHFLLLGAETRRSEIRGDGFPGLGVAMPDFGLPRLLLGGRTAEYRHEIPVGATVRRTSAVKSVAQKNNAAGKLVVVTVGHELNLAEESEPAIVETQTYLLLPGHGQVKGLPAQSCPVTAEYTKSIVPDDTLLFHYSAHGFNSHKIHLDRSYAREVEGFPDLVVNGGLTTLLLMEFARIELGLSPRAIRMKNIAPLFCDRSITLAADRVGEQWRLRAHDDKGQLAAEMEVDVK